MKLANTLVSTHYKTLNRVNSGMIGKASFYFKTIHSLSDGSDVRISKRGLVFPTHRIERL